LAEPNFVVLQLSEEQRTLKTAQYEFKG